MAAAQIMFTLGRSLLRLCDTTRLRILSRSLVAPKPTRTPLLTWASSRSSLTFTERSCLRVKPKVDRITSIYVAVVVRRHNMAATPRRNRLGDEFRRRELLTRLDLDLQGLILALVEGLQSAAPST